jgi:ribosomal protein S27AE
MTLSKEYEVKPWTCPKCGERVYIAEKLHEYVCRQYQKLKEKADGKAGR